MTVLVFQMLFCWGADMGDELFYTRDVVSGSSSSEDQGNISSSSSEYVEGSPHKQKDSSFQIFSDEDVEFHI